MIFVGWHEVERGLIAHKCEIHGRFLELVEPHLKNAMRDWENTIDQQAAEIEDDDLREQFYEFCSDEYYDHLEFQTILLNSFFAASFALFEDQLLRICRKAQVHCGNPLSVHDLRSSSPTDRAKTYLGRLGIDFPADTPEWGQITKFRELRNRIMHEGGSLRDSEHVLEYAKAKKIVSGSSDDPYLALTRQFCEESLTLLKDFLMRVLREYQVWR